MVYLYFSFFSTNDHLKAEILVQIDSSDEIWLNVKMITPIYHFKIMCLFNIVQYSDVKCN